MPDVDERIRVALRSLADPADPAGAFERVAARRDRRRTVHRLQVLGLVVAVLAGTGAGTFALARAFHVGRTVPADLTRADGRIAFAEAVGLHPDSIDDYEIFTTNADGTGLRRLTRRAGFDFHPAWSPDGTRIAFVSGRFVPSGQGTGKTLDTEIRVMDADGSHVRVLDPCAGVGCADPVWSPDGSAIAYARDRSVWVADAGGASTRQLDPCQAAASCDWADIGPAWLPDGRSLLFVRAQRFDRPWLYRIGRDGTGLVALRPNLPGCPGGWREPPAAPGSPPSGNPRCSSGRSLAVSPGGTMVAFTRGAEVDVLALGSSAATVLARCPLTRCSVTGLAWAPDGGRVAFAGTPLAPRSRTTDVRANPYLPGHIFAVAVDGSGLRQVTDRAARYCCLSWTGPARTGPHRAPGPTPTPSPTASGPAQAACRGTALAGDFDGDGRSDRARIAPTPCLASPRPIGPAAAGYSVDVRYGSGAEGVWPLAGCRETCTAFAAPDLDGDGAAELLVTIEQGASSRFLEAYELPLTESGPIRPKVSSPGSARYPAGRPAAFEWGGSVTHQGNLRCSPGAHGRPRLVATVATLSSDGTTWSVVVTRLVLGHDEFVIGSEDTKSVPAGSPAADGLFAGPTVCGAPTEGLAG